MVQGTETRRPLEFELQRKVYRVLDDTAFEKVVSKGAEIYGQPRATLASFRRSQAATTAAPASQIELASTSMIQGSACQLAPSAPLRGQALFRAWRLAKGGFLDPTQVKRSRIHGPEESRAFVVGEQRTDGDLEVVSEGKVYAVRDVAAFAKAVIQSVPPEEQVASQGVASSQTFRRCTTSASSLVRSDDGHAPRRTLRELIRAQRAAAAAEETQKKRVAACQPICDTPESLVELGLWDSQWTTSDQERREALGRAWRLAKQVV